jgi:DNA gyrase subunit A
MTEVQADAVVRMQLGQLAALERDEILKEYHDLRRKILGWEQLLGSERNLRDVVKAELAELRGRYGDERRTEITGELAAFDLESLIPEEAQAVTISHKGYIKRLPLTTYRSQHRGGKGVSGGATRDDDDFIEHFFVASTHAYLLCFTNRGQLYWLRVFDIPEGSRTGMGRAIANVLSLKPEEKITSVIPVRRFEAGSDQSLIMATRRGLVKKTALQEYSRPRAGGIIGVGLKEGDTLIDVALTKPGDEVVLCTRKGMAIRFDEADARSMGRGAAGVRGIRLVGDDEVVGMVVADPGGFLLTVCANGYAKRTPFGANTEGAAPADGEAAEVDGDAEEAVPEPAAEADDAAEAPEEEGGERSSMYYRKQRRGGKGVRDVRISTKNGPVVGALAVRETDDIMLITTGGMVNRTHVSEIRVVGRNTQGVRVMGLKEGDRIASVAKVAHEEGDARAEPEAPADATPPAEPPADVGPPAV